MTLIEFYQVFRLNAKFELEYIEIILMTWPI